MSRRLLQVFAALNVLVALYKGGSFLVLGIAAVPVAAGADLAAQLDQLALGILDTWYRVLGWFWISAGLMLAWITPSIERETAWFRLIFVAFMSVGVSRLASVLQAGISSENTASAIALEILIPSACIGWQTVVARQARLGAMRAG